MKGSDQYVTCYSHAGLVSLRSFNIKPLSCCLPFFLSAQTLSLLQISSGLPLLLGVLVIIQGECSCVRGTPLWTSYECPTTPLKNLWTLQNSFRLCLTIWLSSLTSCLLPPTLRHSQMLHLRPWIVVYILPFHFCKGNFTIKMLSLIFARENQSQLL